MKALIKSFGFAFRGIYAAFKERNFRIDVFATVSVILFSAFYGLSKTEWALLFVVCAAVLSAETFNTALEKLCDKVTEEKCDEIKNAKDLAAGAVLIKTIFSVVTAIFLFSDAEKLSQAFSAVASPYTLIFIAAGAVFVFLPEKRKRK